jgi:hypothetical protein
MVWEYYSKEIPSPEVKLLVIDTRQSRLLVCIVSLQERVVNSFTSLSPSFPFEFTQYDPRRSVPQLVQRKLPCKSHYLLTPSLLDPPCTMHKPQRCDDVLAATYARAQFSNQVAWGHSTKTCLLHAYSYDHDIWQRLPPGFPAYWTIRKTYKSGISTTYKP